MNSISQNSISHPQPETLRPDPQDLFAAFDDEWADRPSAQAALAEAQSAQEHDATWDASHQDGTESLYTWEDFMDEPFVTERFTNIDILPVVGEPELCEAGSAWNVEVATREGTFTYRTDFSVEGAYNLAQRVHERGEINTAYWVKHQGLTAEAVSQRYFEFTGESRRSDGHTEDLEGDTLFD